MKCDQPTLPIESTGRPPKRRPPRWRGEIVGLVLSLSLCPLASHADESFRPTPSADAHPVVATDQSETSVHRATTQAIRRALIDDDSLSLSAKNIVVVTTADGIVTVRGSVTNPVERATVLATARRIAAPAPVVDQLEVRVP